MKFMVVYFFAGHDDESAQIDIVNYKDKKSCEKAYSSGEYKILEIQEYDEKAILEDMYCEENDNSDEYNDEEYAEESDDYAEDGLSILFPNADTGEKLDEELEHSFVRMLDN